MKILKKAIDLWHKAATCSKICLVFVVTHFSQPGDTQYSTLDHVSLLHLPTHSVPTASHPALSTAV